MWSKKLWLIIPALLVLGASIVLAAPNAIGNIWRLHNQTLASFAAAAALNQGGVLEDTTSASGYISNGSRWNSIPTVAAWTALSNTDASPAVENANFLGPFSTTIGQNLYIEKITCNWGQTGTGGTTGVVAQIFDTTAAAAVCTCTLGACTTAALIPLACDCNTQLSNASARALVMRITSATDCTENPHRVRCAATLLGGP